MSHQHKRRKMTREERAKRNRQKAERRAKINQVIGEMERLAKRAEDSGIKIPDAVEARRYGRERS